VVNYLVWFFVVASGMRNHIKSCRLSWKNAMVFPLQLILTFLLQISIFLILSRKNFGGEAEDLFQMIVFQPILAIVFTLITIIACLIIGLPIRMNKKIKHWWAVHFYIALSGFILGLILIGLSTMQTPVPGLYLSLPGWFLTAFCALHFFPGRKFGK
jgi:energy-converting hydrogenase Eha subunit A